MFDSDTHLAPPNCHNGSGAPVKMADMYDSATCHNGSVAKLYSQPGRSTCQNGSRACQHGSVSKSYCQNGSSVHRATTEHPGEHTATGHQASTTTTVVLHLFPLHFQQFSSFWHQAIVESPYPLLFLHLFPLHFQSFTTFRPPHCPPAVSTFIFATGKFRQILGFHMRKVARSCHGGGPSHFKLLLGVVTIVPAITAAVSILHYRQQLWFWQRLAIFLRA